MYFIRLHWIMCICMWFCISKVVLLWVYFLLMEVTRNVSEPIEYRHCAYYSALQSQNKFSYIQFNLFALCFDLFADSISQTYFMFCLVWSPFCLFIIFNHSCISALQHIPKSFETLKCCHSITALKSFWYS